MPWRRLLPAVALLAVALACVRLALWQLARLAEKRALKESMEAALAAPEVRLAGPSAPLSSLRGRRVGTAGRFDQSRQVLLSGVVREGEPGVRVLTPLEFPLGGAVLVERGWLAAQDAVSARPQDFQEPGPRWVSGVAESLPIGLATAPWRALEADSVTVWSVHVLSLDSVRTHFPYPVAPFTLRELPAAGLPARPLRSAPEPVGTSMHLSYAIQWFVFAAASVAGALFLLMRPGSARPREGRA